ncbi:MAG: allantoinase AllB, partial [Spirochaetaceae bacterium]
PLNSHPPTLTRAAFRAKRERLEERSIIDFALWGGLTPSNLDCLEELAECGVIGFKAFMSPSGIDDFENCDDLTLLRGMERAAGLGLPVAVHAESAAITEALALEARRQGRSDAAAFFESRPVVAELEAIDRALLFAEETGCRLHVVHVSTARGIERIRHAVESGRVDATCETCPHYLLLNQERAAEIGTSAKCAPPLRGEAERRELLRALERGEIDTVGSDHSPSPPEMKRGKSFMDAWGGIAGGQVTLRALLSLGLPPAVIARVTASAPAGRFRLRGKGRILPGYDGDITLVAMDDATETILTREELQDRHRISPYIGMALRGRVRHVFLRGTEIYRDGAWTGERPGGRFVPSGPV